VLSLVSIHNVTQAYSFTKQDAFSDEARTSYEVDAGFRKMIMNCNKNG